MLCPACDVEMIQTYVSLKNVHVCTECGYQEGR